MAHDSLLLLHFNDVYNVTARQKDPVGGVARFATLVDQFADQQALLTFGGDALSPSTLSTVTKGEHMSEVLNRLNVGVAVVGNHDLDFGVGTLAKVIGKSSFPWLLSNVVDRATGKPLADASVTWTVTWQGRKLGFVGIVEEDWIATLGAVDPDDVEFVDPAVTARELATQLREEGAEVVIALTHMRQHNDEQLARDCGDCIDMILGGHDHHYAPVDVDGILVLKGGTDFRHLTEIRLDFTRQSPAAGRMLPFTYVHRLHLAQASVKPQPAMQAVVDRMMGDMASRLDKVIGHTDVDLDGRFDQIRRKETTLGNFVCDVVLHHMAADVVMLNSGTFRSDRIHAKGPFRLRDLVAIFPMQPSLVLLSVTGQVLLEALENSVAAYPALEGRFCQVAGVSYKFEAEQVPGNRIDEATLMVGGEPWSATKRYKLATTYYICKGKDGFTMLSPNDADPDSPVTTLMTPENAIPLATVLRNHLRMVSALSGMKPNRAKSKLHGKLMKFMQRGRTVSHIVLPPAADATGATPATPPRTAGASAAVGAGAGAGAGAATAVSEGGANPASSGLQPRLLISPQCGTRILSRQSSAQSAPPVLRGRAGAASAPAPAAATGAATDRPAAPGNTGWTGWHVFGAAVAGAGAVAAAWLVSARLRRR